MTPQYVDIHTHRSVTTALTLRTAGIHPWDAQRWDTGPLPKPAGDVQAIGETGLDYASGVDRTRQAELFRAQLRLAEEHKLPVVVHCVRAFEPIMKELAGHKLRAVVFHGFIGSPEQARQALERGYYLSFGERTFASPKSVAALRAAPLAQLFLETDDSPISIAEIYTRAAELRGTTVEELKHATTQNYKRILNQQHG